MEALTAHEIQAHPLVITAFEAAWADSFPDDQNLRHEEGGWIYQEATSVTIRVRRAAPGRRDEIDLARPPHIPGYYLIATYHTHPNPTATGWLPDPSPEDYHNGQVTGVPWFVISDQGVVWVGPDRREGGLTGATEFPLIEGES